MVHPFASFSSNYFILESPTTYSIHYSVWELEPGWHDHYKYHPSFIIADEGAYHLLFDHSNLADVKEFFGGKGKALQYKNKTCKGMSWVGIPVLLAANDLQYYM